MPQLETPEDIDSLIENGVAEDLSLEFKRQPYGKSDHDKKELLKDITSFANSDGGTLLIGIAEEENVAAEVVPIPISEVDEEIVRIESLLQACVEPRLTGYKISPVQIDAENCVLKIEVPSSWSRPHRANYQKTKRFFMRNSKGNHEMSVEELRVSFFSGDSRIDQIRSFVENRVARIHLPIFRQHQDGFGVAIVHLVSLNNFRHPINLDLESVGKSSGNLFPIHGYADRTRPNADGYLTQYTNGDKLTSECQLFRDGTIESWVSDIVTTDENRRIAGNSQRLFLGSWLVPRVVGSILRYAQHLKSQETHPPYLAFLTLSGMSDACGMFQNVGSYRVTNNRSDRDIIVLPEVLIESADSTTDIASQMKPMLDALWNAFGFNSCFYFDADKNWQPPNS